MTKKLLLLIGLTVFFILSESLYAGTFIFKYLKAATLMTVFMLASAVVTFWQGPFQDLFTSRSEPSWQEEPIDEPLISDYAISANRRGQILEQDIS